MNNYKSIEKEIDIINNIICEAIAYGEDAGCPYFGKNDLTKEIENLLIAKEIYGEYMVTHDDIDGYPKIIRRTMK